MLKQKLKSKYYAAGAIFTTGMLMARETMAQDTFNDILDNINDSTSNLPGLLTGVAYMVGLGLFALGVGKIKAHVENPAQTPLKDGAIRLLAGGALFAIPIVTNAMRTTVGDGTVVEAASLKTIDFNTQ